MILVSYKVDDGRRSALLLKEGRKYLHVLVLDNPLVVRRVLKSEGQYMKVMRNDIGKARKIFRWCAKQWYGSVSAIPKSVRVALRGDS